MFGQSQNAEFEALLSTSNRLYELKKILPDIVFEIAQSN